MFLFESQALPLPVVSGVVTPNFVSPVGRKQEEICAVGRGSCWISSPSLCRGTAGFSMGEGRSRENGKPSAVLTLLTLFQLQEEVGGPAWSNPKKPVAAGKAYASLEESWAGLHCRAPCLPLEQGHCQSWRLTRAEISWSTRKCVNSRN